MELEKWHTRRGRKLSVTVIPGKKSLPFGGMGEKEKQPASGGKVDPADDPFAKTVCSWGRDRKPHLESILYGHQSELRHHGEEEQKTLSCKRVTADTKHSLTVMWQGRNSQKVPVLRLKNTICLKLSLSITAQNFLYPTIKMSPFWVIHKNRILPGERQTYWEGRLSGIGKQGL